MTDDDACATTSPRRFAWLMLPLFVATYQILAKHLADVAPSAGSFPAWLASILTSHLFWMLLGAEVMSFALWMYLLARLPLGQAFSLSALSYVVVIVAGWAIFGEAVDIGQIIGAAAIVTGIWLVGRMPDDDRAAEHSRRG